MKLFFCLYMTAWIIILCGCASLHSASTNSACKRKSIDLAVRVLKEDDNNQAIETIKSIDDADALRIIAVAAQATAWPMEAGENMNFDNSMNDISIVAILQLSKIGTKRAKESINYAKRFFTIDGAASQFFKSINVD